MVPLSNRSQRDPLTRPRPPHRLSSSFTFLETANRCIPTCTSAQDVSGGVRVPCIGHTKQPGRADQFPDAFAPTCLSRGAASSTLRLAFFARPQLHSDVCWSIRDIRNMEGGGLHVSNEQTRAQKQRFGLWACRTSKRSRGRASSKKVPSCSPPTCARPQPRGWATG